MNHPSSSSVPENAPTSRPHQGFIAFCEASLRYEKGFKAWIYLGPYLLGAFALERIVNASENTPAAKLALWLGFVAYLVIFPEAWRRVLRWWSSQNISKKKAG